MSSKILEAGKSVFIRTVTYHMVGKIVSIDSELVELENASWVADSGRFGQAIQTGKLNEVEYVGDQGVSRGAIVDYFPWKHDLPTETK